MKRIQFTLLLIVFAIGSIMAAPLKNVPCTITQPNGEVIHCFASGDEFFNYYHDANGYTIIMNQETGYYTYAVKVNDEVLPSEYIVGQVEPSMVAALVPYVRENPERILARRMEWERQMRQHNRPNTRLQNHGLMFNLVVFISFSDDTVFNKTYSQVEAMFNDTSSASVVSMKNYYRHVSYNQFAIHTYLYPQPGPNDVIISYHDSHPEDYYRPHSPQNPIGYTDGAGRHIREMDLLEAAIDYVRDLIPYSLNLDYDDDGDVDNVVFVVNCNVGGWNDLLWPHRSTMYDRVRYINGKQVYDYNLVMADNAYYFDVSTLCHEMFHSLSAPDLYTYDQNSDFTFVGSWDLMEGNAKPPQNMGAYMKMKYGHWIDEIPEAETTGLYTIYPVSTSPNCAYRIYPDRLHHPNQFLVIEFRNTNTPFDGSVYGSGAVIYRINSDFDGNASTDLTNYFPEVFAFRKNGWPLSQTAPYLFDNGYMAQSYFGGNTMMNEFSEYTNPYPYYCNNTPMTGFRITDITNYGDSLQFYLVKGDIVVDTFPWVEPFEAQNIPYYCYNEYVNNYTSWKTRTGNNNGTISSAHSGNKNASFYATANSTTKLVMPVFDFTFLLNPTLSFWYGQASGSNYSLKVYYRTSSSDDWTLLQTYSTFTGQWTQATLNLPNPSATYQIAFESAGINGSGLILDDIMVSGTPITGFTINASAGNDGQISPSGAVQVQLHDNQTFVLTPDQGYTVDELLVDGTSQQRALIYTFEDVVEDHTISASFRTANPTLNAYPTALFFSTAGGETSMAKSVNVIVGDFMDTEDVLVQAEEPFLVSNDNENFGLQTTVPYNGGTLYVVFTPPFGGNYSKTLTIANQVQSVTVGLNGVSTGIEEQQSDAVRLYPNPASDKLNLVFNERELPEKVEIVDVCGRTVLSCQITGEATTVNISGLESGVYFVKADNIVKKFIKK